MDLQTYLDNAIKAGRQESLARSDQLTLGELILKLEPIMGNQEAIIEKYEHEANVCFDFEYLHPDGIDSWRGIYAELALGFTSEGDAPKISVFLKMLKETVGKTFVGYKGGDFTMSRQTPVWAANYGNSGNTAVIDVVDDEYQVILITGYRES